MISKFLVVFTLFWQLFSPARTLKSSLVRPITDQEQTAGQRQQGNDIIAEEYFGVPKLDTYNVDKNKISVSGFDSGGFFAVQFHVAFSKTIMGAGIAAGGPYWCAKGNYTVAHSQCMSTTAGAKVEDYVNKVMTASEEGKIDSPDYLPTDWVYLFSSANDTVLNPDVVKNAENFYRNFVAKGFLMSQYNINGEHAFLTDDYGNPCQELGSPYINNCGFSFAQMTIQAIYIGAKPDKNSSQIDKNLFEFDQSDFITSDMSTMDAIGYIYVPTACQSKTKMCPLHIVFHGCQQGRDTIGSTFAMHTEYNGIAEVNDIIMLYPQVKSVPGRNPRGCWDWVGFTGSNYIYQNGFQMDTVKKILNKATGLT